jgi:hypothetical protein
LTFGISGTRGALPHDDLIERFCGQMNHLPICAGNGIEEVQLFEPTLGETFYKLMGGGSCVKAIQYCHNLDSLTMRNADIRDGIFDGKKEEDDDDDDSDINYPIERVDLEYCRI